MFISSLLCIALLALSFAHFMWAFGSTWPVKDETVLARTILGFEDAARMQPRLLSLGLALLMLAGAVWALALADHNGGGWLLSAIGIGLAILFLGRGIAGYTPGWKEKRPQEPFRTNNRKVYSPLSLFIGAGFALLVIMRLI